MRAHYMYTCLESGIEIYITLLLLIINEKGLSDINENTQMY